MDANSVPPGRLSGDKCVHLVSLVGASQGLGSEGREPKAWPPRKIQVGADSRLRP